jgi:hypothetical protein
MSRVFSGSSLLSAIGNNYAMRRDGARQKNSTRRLDFDRGVSF